mgnify:CR=1 FL=1
MSYRDQNSTLLSGTHAGAPWSQYTTEQLLDIQLAIASELSKRYRLDHYSASISLPETHLEEFGKLFIFSYREREKYNYEVLISYLTDTQYCNKDRARLAWAIYNSGKLLLHTKPNTFKKWLQQCNTLLNWDLKTFYDPSKLKPNKLTHEIAKYL